MWPQTSAVWGTFCSLRADIPKRSHPRLRKSDIKGGHAKGYPMSRRPGGELASRPLHFFWICDCSGSMQTDGKIQSLNNAIREDGSLRAFIGHAEIRVLQAINVESLVNYIK